MLVLVTRSFGFTLGRIIFSDWKGIDMRLRVPAEISLGFLIFSLLLLGAWMLGYYTLNGLLIILAIFSFVWVPGFIESYHNIKTSWFTLYYSFGNFSLKNELRTISIELSFFIFTLLLAVSLISIIRPMPIWWDDLGIYMNYPKIMATTGELIKWAGMYAWQLITWTGFLFWFNASQAFYVNQIGWILSVIFIFSVLSYGLESRDKKYLLSLPALLAVFYYAMPMTVFQQSKDMKLDPAYLAFSISTLWLLFYTWKNYIGRRSGYILLGIIGIIVWFTFTIKFTSLMLILWVLWVLSYAYFSYWGYVGFFFLFLAIFTQFGLWSMMNVPMPKDPWALTSISNVLYILAIIWFSIDIKTIWSSLWMKKLSEWFFACVIFLVGVGISCLPWISKNLYEHLSFSSPSQNSLLRGMLVGRTDNTLTDYSKIYSIDEIKDRETLSSQIMTWSGKSENEDLGRYFWYENGINNYLKLPANLTFQKNQSGEFTDITYLFLALVPSILLFVVGKREYTFILGSGGIIVFLALYYFTDKIWATITNWFSPFTLIFEASNWKSIGYIILIIINLSLVAFIHFGTKDTENNKKLRDVSVFMGIYAFLFVIAAFGIVWYGIIIYFWFFLIIGLAANRFLEYDDLAPDKQTMSMHITAAGILFIFIITYFVRSAFPHGWNNLKGAYYNEYKYNILSQEESIFAYRSDYLTPIATMNLIDSSKATEGIEKEMKSSIMKNFLSKTNLSDIPLDQLHGFVMKYRWTDDLDLKKDVLTLWQSLYEKILYPTGGNVNTAGIYRIGTFMTYLINKNNTRYFDDSLVMAFRDYFYDSSPEVTVERMRKMDLRYLLVDLNAATIDRDPRHDLTTRFENLLLTMNAKNLRLVSTDNFCLELALSERKRWKIASDEAFIDIAGTNYESYRNGIQVNRNQKLGQCHMYIIKLINENRAGEYPKIKQIADQIIATNAAQNVDKLQEILSRYVWQSWFALFEILDVPVETESNVSLSGIGTIKTQSGETR
jgi:hypothetical protein